MKKNNDPKKEETSLINYIKVTCEALGNWYIYQSPAIEDETYEPIKKNP